MGSGGAGNGLATGRTNEGQTLAFIAIVPPELMYLGYVPLLEWEGTDTGSFEAPKPLTAFRISTTARTVFTIAEAIILRDTVPWPTFAYATGAHRAWTALQTVVVITVT